MTGASSANAGLMGSTSSEAATLSLHLFSSATERSKAISRASVTESSGVSSYGRLVRLACLASIDGVCSRVVEAAALSRLCYPATARAASFHEDASGAFRMYRRTAEDPHLAKRLIWFSDRPALARA